MQWASWVIKHVFKSKGFMDATSILDGLGSKGEGGKRDRGKWMSWRRHFFSFMGRYMGVFPYQTRHGSRTNSGRRTSYKWWTIDVAEYLLFKWTQTNGRWNPGQTSDKELYSMRTPPRFFPHFPFFFSYSSKSFRWKGHRKSRCQCRLHQEFHCPFVCPQNVLGWASIGLSEVLFDL